MVVFTLSIWQAHYSFLICCYFFSPCLKVCFYIPNFTSSCPLFVFVVISYMLVSSSYVYSFVFFDFMFKILFLHISFYNFTVPSYLLLFRLLSSSLSFILSFLFTIACLFFVALHTPSRKFVSSFSYLVLFLLFSSHLFF